MLTVGVDLAKRKSQFAVIDERGTVIDERKLPNDKDTVQTFLKRLPGKVQVSCETCTNTYWLVEVVEDIGIPIYVGHALKLKLIAESRIKTDKIDARVIAELLRVEFFPQIKIPPQEIRQIRELLRGRVLLVRTKTQAKNRLHGVLSRAGLQYGWKDTFGKKGEAWLEEAPLKAGSRFMAKLQLQIVRDLENRVKEVEKELVSQVMPQGPWMETIKRLKTIPGVGDLSAMLFLLELWDIERFPSAKKLASYVGLVPSVHQTGKTLRGGPITKQGNAYVRWALVQCAWSAVRSDLRYRGIHEHHARRHGRAKAIIPVARQLLTDIYEIWKNGITYKELIQQKRKRKTG